MSGVFRWALHLLRNNGRPRNPSTHLHERHHQRRCNPELKLPTHDSRETRSGNRAVNATHLHGYFNSMVELSYLVHKVRVKITPANLGKKASILSGTILSKILTCKNRPQTDSGEGDRRNELFLSATYGKRKNPN